ncbi:MAG: GAF domain-containing protein, partial [Deltaproteobacteria bacterium]
MKGIHKVFDNAGQDAEFYVEYMDTKRFPKQLDPEQLASIQKHLTEKYRTLQPQLIITVDDDALRFMLDRQETIFPRVPIVFCGVNNPVDEGKIAASKAVTGVMEVLDRKATIDAALALHPGTKKLAVITDTTTNGIGNRLLLKELAKVYAGRIKFDFLDQDGTGITLDDLRSRLSKLDDETIVYYGDFFRDKNGFLDQETIIPILSKESRRPIYSPYSFVFGLGTVGGKLNSALFQGEKAAQMAKQILKGASPSRIPVIKESINHFMFDFRQMERWGILKDRLPADSIVMYKSPSFFEQYRQLVIATLIAFIILISVIAALIVSIYRRKQAESFLRASEERYRTLIEQMPDMIWHKDTNGNYLSCNSNYAKVLGVTVETINGHRDEDFYTPELAEKYQADDQSVVVTGQPFETEELWEQSGETHYLQTSKVPLFDGKGAIIGTIGIGRDITERKQTETKLRLNESRLKSLVEILQFPAKTIREFLDNALNEAVKLTDSTIGYIYFYHEERQEFELNSWSNEVMKECAVLAYQTIYHLDKTGIWGEAVRQRKPIIVNDFKTEHPLRKGYPQGHVHLTRFMTVPVFSNDKIVAVVGIANKTSDYDEENVLQLTLLMNSVWKYVENKRGEEERDKLESQLHQAQKMESVGSLAGGVAHDFNNKLSVILGCTYMAFTEEDPVQLKTFLEEIRKAAEQSADLTRQLLAFARKQTIAPKVLDLNETVTGMLKMLNRLIGEDIHLTWQPAHDLWPLKFDPSQVDQILAN